MKKNLMIVSELAHQATQLKSNGSENQGLLTKLNELVRTSQEVVV